MRTVPRPDVDLAWLVDRTESDNLTGIDAVGWEASTWVLHTMYENPTLPANVTYQERRQQGIALGVIEPLMVGNINLDEDTVLTGIPLGFAAHPGPDWRRLRWREYATRSDRLLGVSEPVPPCYRWFATGSWPINIIPPTEGSLDAESLNAVIRVLAAQSFDGLDTQCFAFYGSVVTNNYEEQTLLAGSLGSVPDLVATEARFRSTPSNIWPADRSWFIWTDWDLWGTKVSGSWDLIAAIKNDDGLETIDWRGGERD